MLSESPTLLNINANVIARLDFIFVFFFLHLSYLLGEGRPLDLPSPIAHRQDQTGPRLFKILKINPKIPPARSPKRLSSKNQTQLGLETGGTLSPPPTPHLTRGETTMIAANSAPDDIVWFLLSAGLRRKVVPREEIPRARLGDVHIFPVRYLRPVVVR